MFEETSGKHYREILSESLVCQHIGKTVYCAELRGEKSWENQEFCWNFPL